MRFVSIVTILLAACGFNAQAQPQPANAPQAVAITFHVTWQGAQWPFGHALIQVRTPEGLYAYDRLTDPTGHVTVSLPMTDTSTSFDYRIKGLKYLAVGDSVEGYAGETIEAPELPAGDIGTVDPECDAPMQPGDNVVDSADFSAFQEYYGEYEPCCCPDIYEWYLADLNEDEYDVVDIADFNLLRGNFGESGYEFP